MRLGSSASFALAAIAALPATLVAETTERVQDSGGASVWIFANISYAGMRAQNSPSAGWRVLSFIFGFPGTLLSFFVIAEGSERAYGIDLPRKAAADVAAATPDRR